MNRNMGSLAGRTLVLAFFALFFFFPILHVVRGGLTDEAGHFTVTYVMEIFRNPVYLAGLRNAFAVALCTTLLCLTIALPLAWMADRFVFPGKRLLTAALLLPMILPPFVGAVGMQAVFGHYGAANMLLEALHLVPKGGGPDWFGGGFAGIVLIEALHLYPILYLNCVAAFANVDPTLLEAAADCGCTGFRRFRRITLPLIMPGVFAGGTLVFIWSFTELGTPLMFQFGRITPVQVFDGIQEIGDNAIPYALVLVMMTAAAALYALAKLAVGRQSHAMVSKAGSAARAVRPSKGVALLVAGAFCAVVLLGTLPHIGVIGLSVAGRWYQTICPEAPTVAHYTAALGHGWTVRSIRNSVLYASLAVSLALLLGVFAAHAIVRGKGRGRWLLDVLTMLPLAVPGLVLAFGYLAMTRKGCLLAFLDPVSNPTILLVIAYAVRRLPYVVRAVVAGLQQTSVSYEEAAASLGAGVTTCFRRITMPLIGANLIAGAIIAFSFSMLEVSDSLLLAQRSVYFPITKAIYELSMLYGQGQALAASLGVWTMVFLATSLLVASSILGRRLGALFRV
ncbi:MAG: iron ABC transporter permease [Lentisphaeria bacterium]|nr:iron ABC transporter permease [Lentisphaeria bacterium]